MLLFYLDLEAENFQNENMMRDLDGLWKCMICSYSSYSAKQKQHVRYHIDCKHMSLEYYANTATRRVLQNWL